MRRALALAALIAASAAAGTAAAEHWTKYVDVDGGTAEVTRSAWDDKAGGPLQTSCAAHPGDIAAQGATRLMPPVGRCAWLRGESPPPPRSREERESVGGSGCATAP